MKMKNPYKVIRNTDTTHKAKWLVMFDDGDRCFIVELCETKPEALGYAKDYNDCRWDLFVMEQR